MLPLIEYIFGSDYIDTVDCWSTPASHSYTHFQFSCAVCALSRLNRVRGKKCVRFNWRLAGMPLAYETLPICLNCTHTGRDKNAKQQQAQMTRPAFRLQPESKTTYDAKSGECAALTRAYNISMKWIRSRRRIQNGKKSTPEERKKKKCSRTTHSTHTSTHTHTSRHATTRQQQCQGKLRQHKNKQPEVIKWC